MLSTRLMRLSRWTKFSLLLVVLGALGQGCPPPPPPPPPTDNPPGDNTPPDNTPPDNTPPDNTPPDNAPPDNTPPDNTPPDNTPPDNTPPNQIAGLPAQNQREVFASQCALNVITCTVSWPEAVASVQPLPGQTVAFTTTGVIIYGSDGDGVENVQLVGSNSVIGQTATTLSFSWSQGATDANKCTLAPGEEFSTEADPLVAMEAGLHYVRLTVRNDIIRPNVESNDPECGIIGQDIASFDFVELEIDIRD